MFNHVGVGNIVRKVASRTYIIQIGNKQVRRHIDDIIPYHAADHKTQHYETDDLWCIKRRTG